jgi:hypothetical protein
VTRELPNNFPFVVKKYYISAFVKRWHSPSKQLFDSTKKELNKRIKEVIDDHFSFHTYGHLKQRVTCAFVSVPISPFSSLTCSRHIVQDHIQKRASATEEHINFLLDEEQEPFTMNEHHLMVYRSQFLGYYKGIQQKPRGKFIDNIHSEDPNCKVAVNRVISGLANLDLRPIDVSLLPRLLPTDAMEPAIEIMAEVRAYFQGS